MLKRCVTFTSFQKMKRNLVLASVFMMMFTSACQGAPTKTASKESVTVGITPIVSTDVANTSSVSSETESLMLPSETSKTMHLPEEMFVDDFLVLDNSNGFANVYEIEMELPFRRSRSWASEHPKAAIFNEVNTANWESEYSLNWSMGWFFGSPFNYTTDDSSNRGQKTDSTHDTFYQPPADIVEKTTSTIHTIKASSLEHLDEFPSYQGRGKLQSDWSVVCLDLDCNSFPEETGYLPKEYDTLHLIGIASDYIDGIPVGGTMDIIAPHIGDYVYEYDLIDGPTIGGALILGKPMYSRNKDVVVGIKNAKNFDVTRPVRSNLVVKPIDECLSGIQKASDYDTMKSGFYKDTKYYAAELAYMPISDYDVNAYDYAVDGHTYLIPVWQVYYKGDFMGMGIGTGCIVIDAVTGESIYSTEYSYQDKRIFGSEI